jgi:hypothetical protein
VSVTVVPRKLLQETFDLVLTQWPELIEPGEKTFHLGGGCNMRNLNEIRDPIESWVCKADFRADVDEIIGSVEHYVCVCIQSALRDLISLRKADLDFEAFVSRFDGHPNFKVRPNAPNP